MSNPLIRVLVVGQTPPPFYGQAMTIQRLVSGQYKHVRIYHVRMGFSRDIDEVGLFRFRKVLHLFAIIARIYWVRLRHHPTVLHYPPAGPDRIPMYRDLVTLIAVRWLFKKVVFAFHASGVSQLYDGLPRWLRPLYRLAYYEPDVAIRLSQFSPPDGMMLKARGDIVLPNGMEDVYPQYANRPVAPHAVPRILFVGILRESKGVLMLLEACRILKERNINFHLGTMGKMASAQFEQTVSQFIDRHNLAGQVELMGVQTGDAKWMRFREADIMCFPTHYESESFSGVLLEAMQFKLPVISTRWRGIPSIIEDGKSGFLVDIKDSAALAEKLSLLLSNADLRARMGERGREIFLERYTLSRYHQDMENLYISLVNAPRDAA